MTWSSQHVVFGIPELRALRLPGACQARAGRVPRVRLSRAACVPAAGRGLGCRLAAAGLWERLVRRGMCGAPQTVGGVVGSHKRGSGCRTDLLSIVVCG